MSKLLFIDFEFNKLKERNNNPICVSFLATSDEEDVEGNYWLLDPEEREEFIEEIKWYIEEDYTFVAFYAAAEARSLYSLGIDPRHIKWVCLWIEYQMCLNHNHELSTGKHLIDGKVKYVPPPVPKWQRVEGDPSQIVAQNSLAACTYKLLGIDINLEHKDEMRDLIIQNDSFTEKEQAAIMHYCLSDIKHLPEILRKIYATYTKKFRASDRKKLNDEIRLRGHYAACTAIMESEGYPIDYEATRNFSDSVRQILFEMQKEVSEEFPEVGPFLIDKKGVKYTQKKAPIQAWVKSQGHYNWMLTDTGELSLGLPAFERHYSSKGDQSNFGNRFVKYLRNKQSLYGFLVGKKGKSLWDSVGSDQRVRPYFGIYRAQSSRSQPSATSYILLKSSWMRCLIKPPPGYTMIAIDYAQQEFLLAGLLSGDKKMLDAYESGDVYLYTGKLAGAIPWDGTKAEYPEQREKFKSTTLGIQYLMTKHGLSTKLSRDTGVPHSEEEAQDLIDLFNEAYPTFNEYREQVFDDYLDKGYVKLPCGWTMFGDNENKRSVCNMPLQGMGASIMRKGVELAMERGLKVVMTLHDALYIEAPTMKTARHLHSLAECMDEAFRFYFKGTPVEDRAHCRLDPTVWGPDWKDGQQIVFQNKPIKVYETYVDERGEQEYEKYKRYLYKTETNDAVLANL